VPNFDALHEREKQRLERLKEQNRRKTTQAAPFRSYVADRNRSQRRQPPMPKDPTQDYRWEKHRRPASAGRARPSSAPSRAAQPSPAVAAGPPPPPARPTQKTLQQQQYTARLLEERRRQEEQKQHELEQAHATPTELRLRVMQAVGPIEPFEEKVERLAAEKRVGGQRVFRHQVQDLQRIQDRISRRPLLMEQADSLDRARRRALFKVRATLESAGVHNVDSHFGDDELDELERAAERAAARNGPFAAGVAGLGGEAFADLGA